MAWLLSWIEVSKAPQLSSMTLSGCLKLMMVESPAIFLSTLKLKLLKPPSKEGVLNCYSQLAVFASCRHVS